MKTLKTLLQKKSQRGAQRGAMRIDDKTIFFIFKKILQEEYGSVGLEKFKTDYFLNKSLHVKASSSAWAAELWINRNKLIKKINLELGGEYIERLKMK